MFDTVHLGSKGIAMFCLNVKNCIINKKGIDKSKLPTTNQINHNNNEKYPYWEPNPGYSPPWQPPHQHQNHWTGDHSGSFPVGSFQLLNASNLHNGYQT